MKRSFPHLASPITLGRATFRNRIFAAPMGSTDITADCGIGPRTPGFYELRAKGGAAAVTASELVVHPETDGSHMLHLDLQTPGLLAGFTYLADAIKRHGAVPSVELSHSGQYAGTYLVDKDKKAGLCQYGPSDGVRPDGIPVKALTKAQIDDIVKAYGERAALAKRAGFEMVMVHGGHSWLINQFLSPYFNHRTDEYGGSPENRFRIIREIIAEIRKTCGEEFPIMIKVNCNAPVDLDGFKVAPDKNSAVQAHAAKHYDESYWDDICYVVSELDKLDLEFIEVSGYDFVDWKKEDHQFYVKYAEKLLKLAPHTTLFPVGGITSPQDVADVLNAGFEMISMCRALHSEPDIIQKFKEGKESRCLHCNKCFVVPYSTGKCCVFHIKEKA